MQFLPIRAVTFNRCRFFFPLRKRNCRSGNFAGICAAMHRRRYRCRGIETVLAKSEFKENSPPPLTGFTFFDAFFKHAAQIAQGP